MRNFLLALLVFGLPGSIEIEFTTPKFLQRLTNLWSRPKTTHCSSVH
jgi:hypothetical protein